MPSDGGRNIGDVDPVWKLVWELGNPSMDANIEHVQETAISVYSGKRCMERFSPSTASHRHR